MDYQGSQKTLAGGGGSLKIFVILIVVVVLQVYTNVKTY